jgi:DNA polymerase-1
MKTRHLLIDGDILVYRFAHRSQVVAKWDRDLYTFHAFLSDATPHIIDMLKTWQEDLEADELTVVLSDLNRNFRKRVYPEYKAHRGGVVRPILFKPLREYFEREYGAFYESDLEGDDLIGLLATNVGRGVTKGGPGWVHKDDEPVICTVDKDLNTVPGMHFNWDGTEACLTEITPGEAMYNFYMQVLMGDSADGYKGIPGCGPKRAAKLLEEIGPGPDDIPYSDAWQEVIVPAYEKAGLNETVALLNARCARVLQGDDYNFETKEIRLWTP